MKYENSNQTVAIKLSISQDDRAEAKALAKSLGMTFQGWLGNLVKQELYRAHQGQPSFQYPYQERVSTPSDGAGS